MPELVLCILMTLVSWGCGAFALDAVVPTSRCRRLDHTVISIGLGIILFSLAGLVLALCHLLFPWAAWAVLIGLGTVGACRLFASRRSARLPREGRTSVFTVCVACVFFAFVMVNMVNALVPTINNDTLTQFFVYPKMWIAENAITDIDYHFSDNFIFWTILMHAFCMLLSSDILAALFNSWAMGVLSAAGVYILARRYFKPEIAVLSAVIFYSGYVIVWLSASGKINLTLALYEVLAIYCFFAWKDSPMPRKRGWLVLAGIFAGYAAGVHISGLKSILVLTILVGIVSLAEQRRASMDVVRRVLLFAIIAALLASPVAIRNYATTGNPAFPMMGKVFGGSEYTGVFAGDIVDRGQGPPSVRDYACRLWDITMKPWHKTRCFQICPLILAFFPLVILLRKPAPIVWQMLGVALLYYTLWILTQRITRYGFTFISLLSIVAAYTACRLLEARKWVVAAAVLAAIFMDLFMELERDVRFYNSAVSLADVWPMFDRPVPQGFWNRYGAGRVKCALGLMSRDEFLCRASANDPFHPNYRLCRIINAHTPSNAYVFGTSEEEKYWLDRRYLSVRERRGTDLYRQTNPERLAAMLRETGITHVLFSARYIDRVNQHMRRTGVLKDRDFFPRQNLFLDDAFTTRHLRKIAEDRGDVLYEVIGTP